MSRLVMQAKPFSWKLTAVWTAAICLISFASASPAFSQEPLKSELAVGASSRARAVILDNGLTVLLDKSKKDPVVAFALFVKTGSATEGKFSGTGISHFVEHMLFKGTARRATGEIERVIKEAGGSMNGFTTHDYTGYTIQVPSESFDAALDILSDVVSNSSFNPEEVEKERDVILKEIKLNRDDPDMYIYDLLWQNAYLQHTYKHPVIGYDTLVKGLTRDDLFSYYKLNYVPNNMILAVAGDIDEAQALRKIKSAFEGLSRRPYAEVSPPYEPEQVSKRELEYILDVNLGRLAFAFHSTSISEKDMYALDVLAILLGGQESSRLVTELFDNKKLVYAIGAANYTPKYRGLFVIPATLDADKVDAAEQAIWDEINKVKGGWFNVRELIKAKRKALGDYLSERERVERKAFYTGLNAVLTGDPNFSNRYLEGINSVTKDDVVNAAKRCLIEDGLTEVVILPKAYAAKEKKAPLLEKVEEVKKYLLNNRIRVLVREDHTLPVVSIRTYFLGGLAYEDETTSGLSNLVASMLLNGTKTRTKAEIKSELDYRGVSAGAMSGNNTIAVAIDGLSSELDFQLGLLADILNNPTFPASELDKERDVVLADLRSEDEDIFRSGFNLLKAALFKEHPFRFNPLGNKEAISKYTRNDIVRFYRRCLAPKEMVISISGDVNPNYVVNALNASLGNLAAVSPQERGALAEPQISEIRQAAKELDKEQSLIMIGFRSIGIDDADRYIFDVLSAVVSGDDGRLYKRIRNELGLSYTQGAYNVYGLKLGYYVFYVATSPDKLDPAKDELLRIIEELRSVPIPDDEIKRAKKDIVGNYKIHMQSNGAYASAVALDELYGLGYNHYKSYAKNIESVKKEDLARVVNRYFSKTGYALVTVVPKGKSK